VLEVTGLDNDHTEAAPDVGGRWESRYIAGIGRKGDAFVIIFDLERLMESDDAALRTVDRVSGAEVAAA
jgi:purine-binding chemotaxis protein CheW